MKLYKKNLLFVFFYRVKVVYKSKNSWIFLVKNDIFFVDLHIIFLIKKGCNQENFNFHQAACRCIGCKQVSSERAYSKKAVSKKPFYDRLLIQPHFF